MQRSKLTYEIKMPCGSKHMAQVALWKPVVQVAIIQFCQDAVEVQFIRFLAKYIPMSIDKAPTSPQKTFQVLDLSLMLLIGSELVQLDRLIFVQLPIELVNLLIRLL